VLLAGRAAVVALLVLVARRRGLRRDLDLWLWLAAGLIAAATGFRFYGHYFLQAVPPACLLAAPMAAEVAARHRRALVAAVVVPTAVAYVLAWCPGVIRHLQSPDELAAYVDAHTDPGESVMVWGTFPEVYLAADRPPGGGLVHSDFVTGRSGGRSVDPGTLGDATPTAYDTLLHELRVAPPALIVDTSTADLRGYGAYPISLFPELDAFVLTHYRWVGIIDGITIYARREPVRPGWG
jgi:hypothetical protein